MRQRLKAEQRSNWLKWKGECFFFFKRLDHISKYAKNLNQENFLSLHKNQIKLLALLLGSFHGFQRPNSIFPQNSSFSYKAIRIWERPQDFAGWSLQLTKVCSKTGQASKRLLITLKQEYIKVNKWVASAFFHYFYTIHQLGISLTTNLDLNLGIFNSNSVTELHTFSPCSAP